MAPAPQLLLLDGIFASFLVAAEVLSPFEAPAMAPASLDELFAALLLSLAVNDHKAASEAAPRPRP